MTLSEHLYMDKAPNSMDSAKWAKLEDLLYGISEVLKFMLSHDPNKLEWINDPMAHQSYHDGEKQKAINGTTPLHKFHVVDEAHAGVPDDLDEADEKDDAPMDES